MTAKQILKKVTIVVASLAVLYLLILLIAGIYLNSQKESFRKLVETELQKKLNGDFNIGSVDISVWRHFPKIGFSVKGFSLIDSVYKKPVLTAKLVSSRFGLISLLAAHKQVDDIVMEDAVFHLFTDSTGYSNKYLLKLKRDDSSVVKQTSKSAIDIKNIQIKKLDLVIEDALKGKRIAMLVNDMEASMKQSGELIKIDLHENISMKKGLGFKLAKGAYLEDQTVTGKWKILLNKQTGVLSFDNTEIEISKHPILINGHFSFKDNPEFKLNLQTKGISFKLAKAIVTQHIRQKALDLGMEINGKIDVDGSIAGSLKPDTKPAVNLNWQTQNSNFKVGSTTLTTCSFSANFMNSIHPDSIHDDANSKMTLHHFTGNWDGVNLSGKNITVTNLKTPVLYLNIHSDCKLKDLDNKFGFNKIDFLQGTAKLELKYDGPVSDDKAMFQNLEGKLTVANATIGYVPRGFIFSKCNGFIEFFKDSIRALNITTNFLNNQIKVQLTAKNLRRKFLAGDNSRITAVRCVIQSPYLNLEDFTSLLAAKKKAAKVKAKHPSLEDLSEKCDDMLENGVFHLIAKADNIKHQNLLATDFDAEIELKSDSWEIQKLNLNLAGGKIFVNGKMDNTGVNHIADVHVKIDAVEIKKLFFAFNDFGMKDIKGKNLEGSFSTNAQMQVRFNDKGILQPGSLQGNMLFSLKNGALKNFTPLEHIKKHVFKKRNLNDVRFAEIASKIDMNGNNLYLNRMEIASNVFRIYVEGNYDLTGKNTDLLLQIPFYNLNNKNFDDEEMPVNKGLKQDKKNIWLRAKNDKDGQVKLTLTVKPQLKGGTKGQGNE